MRRFLSCEAAPPTEYSMRRHVISLLFAVFCWSVAGLSAPLVDEAFEQRILEELGALDPTAVPLFKQANEVRDEEPSRAVDLYSAVLERGLGFDHADRRLCLAQARLGRRDEAFAHCRRAVGDRPEPESTDSFC